ncbi:MAG TPA: hypothetical protein VIK77_00300 [Tissierellaceae bacterium]
MRLEVFDFENKQSFWEIYPELKLIPSFKALYDNDTDKKKRESSGVMWALQICLHPNSKVYNAPDKWEITKGRLVPKDYDWESTASQKLIEDFLNVTFTEAEKTLMNLDITLKERSKFLKSQKDLYRAVEQSTDVKEKLELIKLVKEFDTIITNTNKLMDEYNKVKKIVLDEETLNKKNISTSDDMGI